MVSLILLVLCLSGLGLTVCLLEAGFRLLRMAVWAMTRTPAPRAASARPHAYTASVVRA